MKVVELAEKKILPAGWFEAELTEPSQPLTVQLSDFIASQPTIQIISMALSENITGFFVPIKTRTLIIVYKEG